MSYIDQDALLERIDGIYDCNDMRFEPNDKCCTVPDDCKGCKWAETKRAIRKIVENMPAADVRPVVRGFWVEENGEDAHTGELWCIWKCSECGARRTAGWRHTQEGRKPHDNFCPNCGAMMEES